MFIVIEGPDGAGKTSQSKALAEAISGRWMCFPDRTTFFGRLVDAWLKQRWSVRSDELPEQEINAAVFQALQTVNRFEVIDQIQRSPVPVVCDRYWMSGYAYGTADGLDPQPLIQIHRLLPQPDLCILLDVVPEALAERMSRREDSTKRDLYERRGFDYFRNVIGAYDDIWKAHEHVPGWIRLRVSAATSFEQTQESLRALVKERKWMIEIGNLNISPSRSS